MSSQSQNSPGRCETRALVADAAPVIPAHCIPKSAQSPAVACVTLTPIAQGSGGLHQVVHMLHTMQL